MYIDANPKSQKIHHEGNYRGERLKLSMQFIKPFFVLLVCLFCVLPVNAKELGSCSYSEVASALEKATEGDIITVPAGTCTWTSGVIIPAGVRLIGAGVDSTVIESNSYITSVLNDDSWLQGFKFINGMAHPAAVNPTNGKKWYCGGYSTCGGYADWVIKDNYFGNTSEDKQTFVLTSQTIEHQGVYHGNYIQGVKFYVDGRSKGQYAWSYEDDLGGTDRVVYFENNVFDLVGYPSAVGDFEVGGQTVWRFNTIKNGYLQTHGARAGDDYRRSARKVEWYRNNFEFSSDSTNFAALWSKGGLTIQFDNECTGSSSKCQYIINSERIYNDVHGLCDDKDAFDTTPHPLTGSVSCRDVVGAGKDIYQSPLPTEDTQSEQADQLYSPSYVWNNTYNSVKQSIVEHLDNNNLIKENIDYFQEDDTDDQGITSGPFASRPVCNNDSKYHGYWATDKGAWNKAAFGDIGYDPEGNEQGVLYQCNPERSGWEVYYTPARYPHPIIKPGAPSKVTLK